MYNFYMREDIKEYQKEYEEWYEKYSPEFLEYDGENGPNFLKAKNTPNEFVWTDHGTCEDNMVSAGFHFFGDPARCCWDTHGWYISEVSSGNTSTDDYEAYKVNMYAECECYNEETEEGTPDCQECYGDGWRTYWFD
jgi:hypothetical protein